MNLKTIAAAAMLAAASLAAQAQMPPPPPGAGMPPAQMRDGQMREHIQQHMQQRMQRRMEGLKRILQITPNQEGAWNAWATAMRPAQPMQAGWHHEREEFSRMTTPERIDRLRQVRARRDAEMDRRADATKVFYTQLTPPQQKAFDEISLKFLKPGRGHRGGHGGW
ncbi:MAG TPA: Spy/CpxP family protein refolding chaperone [Ramlibacter sp.]